MYEQIARALIIKAGPARSGLYSGYQAHLSSEGFAEALGGFGDALVDRLGSFRRKLKHHLGEAGGLREKVFHIGGDELVVQLYHAVDITAGEDFLRELDIVGEIRIGAGHEFGIDRLGDVGGDMVDFNRGIGVLAL